MRKLIISLVLSVLSSFPALANWTGKDATPATITFYNPGACTSVVCTPVFQITDGTNQVTLTTAGADGVSNTLTGVPEYARMLQFNGTTWDRWQGAIKAASGAYAAGAFATGAGVDGWDLTQGAIADAAVAAGATGSVSAKLRAISRDILTVASNTGAAMPAQTGIGNVNIGAVQSAGSKYIAVAASQTATVLQTSTGATGDYLSHCVIYPTSTSPGAVTVFDNTNTAATSAILFAGGASSASNLTPIAVPVGAVSTAGAWKVTTGSAVSVVCYGKFS